MIVSYIIVGVIIMKKILVLAEYYEPFVKGGGPIQSIKNIINSMHTDFNYKVITMDRDLGDDAASTEVMSDDWQQVNNAQVYYTNISASKIIKLLKTTEYDIIYLNSFFSAKQSILPVLMYRMNIIKNKKIILASRGEFSQGALSLKSGKKHIYIALAKFFGFYKDIRWHATAESEKQDILRQFPKAKDIKVAGNLTADYSDLIFNKTVKKQKGQINLIFISRIHKKKNLKFALTLLKSVRGDINYKIYGPIEDPAYWMECSEVINELNDNCSVTYEGILTHEEIIPKLNASHVFLFPTLGENYGHVISEALIGGCPLIISDQTPWRDLKEKEVGFDISLKNKGKFIEAIQHYIELDNEEYLRLAKKAFEYGVEMSNKDKDLEASYNLFKF